jgi:hypothetical protein
MVRLAWFANDTALTHSALERRRQLDSTDRQKAVTGRQLITRFLLSVPRDVPFATNVVLPALKPLRNPEALAAQMFAHVALASLYANSSRTADASAFEQAHIDSAVALYERMPAEVKAAQVDTIGPVFRLGASEASERGDTARTQALFVMARRALARVPESSDYVHDAEAVVRYLGVKAPPIRPDLVYGFGAAPAAQESQTRVPGDTSGANLVRGTTPANAWPRPGRWTVVMPMPSGSSLARFFTNLRGATGDSVDIVFVAATRGFWPPLGPLTYEREGEIMYDYLSNHWHLPGVLLVEHRPSHKLSDGRRFSDPTVTPSLYFNTGLVIDPHGIIRAMINESSLIRLDQMLVDLMRRFPTTHQP